jgi:hypothetical protein
VYTFFWLVEYLEEWLKPRYEWLSEEGVPEEMTPEELRLASDMSMWEEAEYCASEEVLRRRGGTGEEWPEYHICLEDLGRFSLGDMTESDLRACQELQVHPSLRREKFLDPKTGQPAYPIQDDQKTKHRKDQKVVKSKVYVTQPVSEDAVALAASGVSRLDALQHIIPQSSKAKKKTNKGGSGKIVKKQAKKSKLKVAQIAKSKKVFKKDVEVKELEVASSEGLVGTLMRISDERAGAALYGAEAVVQAHKNDSVHLISPSIGSQWCSETKIDFITKVVTLHQAVMFIHNTHVCCVYTQHTCVLCIYTTHMCVVYMHVQYNITLSGAQQALLFLQQSFRRGKWQRPSDSSAKTRRWNGA